MKWLVLWKNKEIVYELYTWFRDIVRIAADAADAAQRLSESVRRGDLNDIVEKTQSVAKKRRDYLDS